MPLALVVDDKEENRCLLEAMLSGHGYEVAKACDGVEALASATAHRPDLIISDILMPQMDGFALCRRCKGDPDLRNVPFVFYTATYTDAKDERFARSLGADLFLVKPQEPDVFIDRMAQLVQQAPAAMLQHPPAPPMEEAAYLGEYNAALIHKLEDKLVELEHARRARDALLAAVSHELRTPLTPVMLLVDMLRADPRLADDIRDDLAAIGSHIEIEKRLIGDLLDFASMHSGSFKPERSQMRMHALIRQVAESWKEAMRARCLTLELHLAAEHDEITGDGKRLEQVFWNLLQNAVRCNPPGGSIVIRSSNPSADEILVEVRDTGSGMDAQTIAWIFAPFAREVRAGQICEEGLGLGLSISRAIVEAHHGTISITSEGAGRGTAVSVRLPRAEP